MWNNARQARSVVSVSNIDNLNRIYHANKQLHPIINMHHWRLKQNKNGYTIYIAIEYVKHI